MTDWPVSRWLGVRTELDIFDDDFLESIPYPNGIATSIAPIVQIQIVLLLVLQIYLLDHPMNMFKMVQIVLLQY